MHFVVVQNILWGFRTVLHYFEARHKPGSEEKPKIRAVGQMAILSNFTCKCTDIVPLLENCTITGVVIRIGGQIIKVRNPTN